MLELKWSNGHNNFKVFLFTTQWWWTSKIHKVWCLSIFRGKISTNSYYKWYLRSVLFSWFWTLASQDSTFIATSIWILWNIHHGNILLENKLFVLWTLILFLNVIYYDEIKTLLKNVTFSLRVHILYQIIEFFNDECPVVNFHGEYEFL